MKPRPREAAPTARDERVNQPALRASNEGGQESVARTDRDLVLEARDGNQHAFRELFDRYHRRAFAVAYGVVKNKQDALDIVQDAFVKVHRHLDSFQGQSSFYTWLYRILMNLAIDHLRKTQKAKDFDYDDEVGRDSSELVGDRAFTPRMAGSNPRKAVMRQELNERIQQALAQLPEHHRAVILLREVEGLSYEEMAEVLEVPKGTIMSRLFHARRKMQQELEEYVNDDLEIKG